MGSRHHLDEEISDEEAQAQLTQLRRELPGIRQWLVQGGIEAREIIRDAARNN
jgi:ribosomal protein L29